MRASLLKLTTCTGIICTIAIAASASPLHRADVAANPVWLLHLDCDALRPTAVGKYILSEMEKPEAQTKLADFRTIFGFDLRTQLHGVTLYSNSQTPEDGVLLLYADFDPAHLVSMAQSAQDYQSFTHGNSTIHSWIDEKKRNREGVHPRIYAAIQGNHVIFSQRRDAVGQALDVAAGTEQNLNDSHAFPDLGAPGGSHTVEAAAQKLNLPDSNPNASILRQAQSAQLALGQTGNQITGNITLVANSDEIAGHILDIAQGLVALGKLQTDKPESAKIANAISFTRNGNRVEGTLALPASDVVDLMKADAARKAARATKRDQSTAQ